MNVEEAININVAKEECKKLLNDTDKVLKDIYKERNSELFKSSSVNWVNLRCVDARISVDQYGDVRHSVLISEASPKNYEFHEAVRERLHENWCYVEVLTES